MSITSPRDKTEATETAARRITAARVRERERAWSKEGVCNTSVVVVADSWCQRFSPAKAREQQGGTVEKSTAMRMVAQNNWSSAEARARERE